jgi:hypothetical protein
MEVVSIPIRFTNTNTNTNVALIFLKKYGYENRNIHPKKFMLANINNSILMSHLCN